MLQVNSMGYLEPGTILTGNYKYQIVSEVGRGAMAVVYLARQIDLDRPVAVKVLSSELASNTSFVLRFFNEVRTAAALSHPNIIQAYDAGIANGDIYYFAMEYVNGETLLRRLLREGRLEIASSLKYATEIASALNYGWQRQRLTHGDIKPENIMVNDLDQAKLADFGLAKVTGHEYEGQELMLTPHYASPELIKGQRPKDDCRADIYAFGASLYHLLSGRPPFPGNDGQEVMRRHLSETVEPLYLRCPGVRPELSRFVASMLEKDAAARPADWMAVLSGLELCAKPYNKLIKPTQGKVRLQRPVGNVRVAPLQGAASNSGNGVLKPRARHRGNESFWWYAIFVFSITLLLIFSYLYWRRLLRQRLDAKMEQAVQESQALDKTVTTQPVVSETEAQKTPLTPDASPQRVVVEQLVPEKDLVASIPENLVVETMNATIFPALPDIEESLPEAAPAAVVAPIYPDYSLFSRLSDFQRQVAAEIQAWFLLASFQHQPGQSGSAEKMMRSLELWLRQNPLRNSFSELIEFVQAEVVPLLDEGTSRLLLNKNALVGQTFSGRNNLKLIVHDVLQEGIKIDQVLDKGTMRREMSWREVMDAQLLLEFYRVVFFETNNKPEVYLAQLLFSQNSKAFQAALRKHIAAGAVYSSRWEELGKKVYLAERELESLRDFAEMARICQQGGSHYEAGRIARRLLSRGSGQFIADNQELLERVLTLCEDLQPDIQAGRLVREAQELVLLQPDQALAHLITAQFLCGPVRYPEKTQIATLQEKAFESLAAQHDYLPINSSVEKWPFLAKHKTLAWPFQGLAWAARLTQARELSEASQNAIFAIAHLSACNWYELLVKEKNPLLLESLPARVHESALPSLLYSRALLLWRNGEEQLAWQKEMPDLYQLEISDRSAAAAKALIYEYAVLCRRLSSKNEQQTLLNQANELWLTGDSENLQCRLRIVLTWLLENKQYQSALEMIDLLVEQLQKKPEQKDFLPELQVLQKTIQQSRETNSSFSDAAAFFQGIAGDGSEYQLRLRLAALGPVALSGAADDALLQLFAKQANGWCLLGGDSIFDWLLRRVAWQITTGDIKLAYQLCEQVLSLRAPCLFAYYPRVHLLRAALLCLNGQKSVLTDVYFQLRCCGAASEQEKRLFRLVDNQAQVNRPAREQNGYFWHDLLYYCSQPTELRSEMADTNQPLPSWKAQDNFAAETVLQQALTDLSGPKSESKTNEEEP